MNLYKALAGMMTACMVCMCLSACGQPASMTQQSESQTAEQPAAAVPQQAPVPEGMFVLEDGFSSEPIPESVRQRMLGKSYPENCDVPFEDLRYLRMDYFGFDGQAHRGEMVVNKEIAQAVLEVFSALYKAEYPIERMVLVDDYGADDEASMAANNTSGFCFRVIEGTTSRSFHADGLAVDINPLYNPYVKGDYVGPAAGAEYVDRTLDNPYYITDESLPYKLFTERGFSWGGEWEGTAARDYQHFALGE